MINYIQEIGRVVTMEEVVRMTGVEDIEDLLVVQRPDPAEFVGKFPVYITYRRNDKLHPFRYAGHCLGDKTVNFDPATAIREYVCSPFSAETEKDKYFYIDLATVICRSLAKDGRMPIAPHLYFPNFLDDDNEEERAWGLTAGIALLDTCHEMTVIVIDSYISEGMQQEIWHAIYDLEIMPHFIRLNRPEAESLIKTMLEKE